MFVPSYRTPTQEEENTYVPQSGFAEYIGAKFVDEFVETGLAADSLQFEATKAEAKAYPDVAQAIIDADIEGRSLHIPFTDPRKEARQAIVGLPRLSKDDWKNSQYYREGMSYEPDITEARLKVYSEWYDSKAQRQNVINRRNAGFIEGAAGFLAGMAGSMPDPINLVSVAVAPEAKLATKVGVAALENVSAELAIQLTTMDIRAEAGIAPTVGERMLNVAFAGIVGGAFGAGAHLFHTRAKARAERESISVSKAAEIERSPVLIKNADGKPTRVEVKDTKPTVNNLTDKTLNNLTVRQKTDILARLDTGLQVLGRGPTVPELNPHAIDFEGDIDIVDPFEKVISDALAGDPVTAKAILDTIGLDDPVVREALMPSKPTAQPATAESLTNAAREIDSMPDIKLNAVDDDQNIDLSNIDVPADDPLLQGNTLFEVADKESNDLEIGLEKAVDLINSDGCA